MRHAIMAAALITLALASVTAASAQTYRDWLNYQYSGYGQCTINEGYGRFRSCDQGGF